VDRTSPNPAVESSEQVNGVSVDQFVSVGESMTPTVGAKGRPHVVVVGAGFAGLSVVKGLKDADVHITIVDRRNHHLFVPLLYQVATAQLTPEHVAQPLRRILRNQKNVRVVFGVATDIDVERQELHLDSDRTLHYDHLVVAVGARDSYFGKDHWASRAWGLKSLEDAERIRTRILLNFELAEKEKDPELRRQMLTYVLVGGGPTGVEMAGAIAELARFTVRQEYANYDPGQTRIVLLEGMDRIFPMFPEKLSKAAQEDLEKLGVEVRTGAMVTDVDETGVVIGGEERIEAGTIIWAAGIQGARLTSALEGIAELDRGKRVQVTPELFVPGHPEIFVIGDAASIPGPEGKPLPAVAPVAMQSGEHVAANILRSMRDEAYTRFIYKDRGSMATVGRNRAVATIGGMEFTGFVAWVLWAVVHILQLISFRNRLFVFFQWAWDYIGYNRNSRILMDHTGDYK
jgi:NADH:ubiquinone reductase (H+-translocating)